MRISDWSSDVCSSDLQHHDRQFAELDAHNPRIPWRYPKSDIDRRSCESDISCSPGSVRKWQTPYWDCRSCTRSDHSPSLHRESSQPGFPPAPPARKIVVSGKEDADRLEHVGAGIIKKKTTNMENI